MINFEKSELKNGLKVIVHSDLTTPLVAVNVLYKVGARNENPERTGFAHLFEHLMFGGSVNIPSFDEPLQLAGGENNAFTTNDITNYHETLPAGNIETALWLESDRMLELSFNPKSLETQRNVVIEEYRQRYLNQPYGDIWLHLRPLAYKVHPYRWATIGADEAHITGATMDMVKEFFYKWYNPSNAILSVAGNISPGEVFKLAGKWFGDIPRRETGNFNLTPEPVQTETRRLMLERNVPADVIVVAFQMPERMHKDYKTIDIISDLSGGGKSSRLFRSLVMEKKIFSEIESYITGNIDKGLLVVEGRLIPGFSFSEAENEIFSVIEDLRLTISETELDKVKNKAETTTVFGYTDILNKASGLAYFEMLGDAGMINTELEEYRKITAGDIKYCIGNYLRITNANIIHYKALK